MGWKCYLCGNKRDPPNKIALHQFPSKKHDNILKLWLDACNLAETDDVSKVRICSSHFLRVDFLSNPIKLRLQPNAIPSQNLKCESGIDSDDDVLLPRCAVNKVPSIVKETNSLPAALKSNPIPAMTFTTIDGASRIILTRPPKTIESNSLKIINSKQLKIIHSRPLEIIDQKPLNIINPTPLKILDPKQVKIIHSRPLEIIEQKPLNIINHTPVKIIDSGPFNIEKLRIQMNTLNGTQMPLNWGFCVASCGLFFNYFGDTFSYPTRSILVKSDMSVEVRGRGIPLPMIDFNKIQCLKDIIDVMLYVSTLNLCSRVLEVPCDGLFQTEHRKSRSSHCCPCRTEMKRATDLARKRTKRKVDKDSRTRKNMRNMRMKLSRAINTVETLKAEIEELKNKKPEVMSSERVIAEMLKTLPIEQQEAVKACITAAKCKGPNGIRYSNSFILECLLLKMKSRRAYLHIRDHNILSLPSISTLARYLKILKPSFGFREETFAALKIQAETISLEERRGVLLLNEMKLNETVLYDLEKLKTMGFSNLSEYNPNDQKQELGDHGLVFVFQPFLGTWSKNVGSFLKKGCANSEALYKLILECIILLENTGFKVDVITTNNTVCNRAMWKRFGLTKFDNYCDHPCGTVEENSSRRLFFSSDFPYLLENLRHFFISAEETWTPDGIFKLAHFRAILQSDEVVHNLTMDHITPKNSQKINIKMAIQLFSPEVVAAMESYKSHHRDLNDCDHTIKFIRKIHRLTQTMTSKSEQDTLSFGNNRYKAILDLREYLEEWEYEAKLKNSKFIPSNVYEALWVTLATVVNVMDFLITDCDHRSLMASRLSQDVLGVDSEINQTAT